MKNFNNCYIEASQEAYDLLVKHGYDPKGYTYEMLTEGYKTPALYIDDNEISSFANINLVSKSMTRFYINNGELSFEKPKEEEDDRNIGKHIKSRNKRTLL